MDGHSTGRRSIGGRVSSGAVVASGQDTSAAIGVIEIHAAIGDAEIADRRFEAKVIARGNAIFDSHVYARRGAAETGADAAAHFHITHHQSGVINALYAVAGHAIDEDAVKGARDRANSALRPDAHQAFRNPDIMEKNVPGLALGDVYSRIGHAANCDVVKDHFLTVYDPDSVSAAADAID